MRSRPRFVRLCVEELESRITPSSVNSTNWSGYAVSSGADTVTAVSGSWVVPAIQAKSSTGYSSAWVGIDGYSSSSVEQIGTASDMVGGVPQYFAWWEMYPSASKTISTVPIHAGDTISASVTYSGGRFQLQITDVTTSKTFSTTQSYSAAQRSSAEWIQEAPSSGGILPLSDFGTINISNAQATINGATGPIDNSAWSSDVEAITMVTNSGALKDKISGLTDSGSPTTSSFSVTWVSSGSSSGGGGGKKGLIESGKELSLPSTAILNELAPSSLPEFQPTPHLGTEAPYSTASFTLATGQPVPLSRDFLLPVNHAPSADASFVWEDSRALMPLAPGKSDPGSVLFQDADSGSGSASLSPTRSSYSTVGLQASELNRLSFRSERTGELNSDREQESFGIGEAQNVILLLILLGAGFAFATESTSERQRQPSLC